MTSLYVYGFVDRSLRPFAIGGHQIEIVRAASLYAAVERRAERPVLSEAALRSQYQIVQRLNSVARAVLPARFGAFVDRDELTRLADQRGDDFARGLAHVSDRAQMLVRLLSMNPETEHDEAPKATATGTEYLRRRQAAATAPVPEIVASLCGAVASLVVDTRIESRAKPPLTTIAHLVPKSQTTTYRRRLRRAAQALSGGVTVTVSGPQAAFAFVPEIWP